jgi:hypothetical protein
MFLREHCGKSGKVPPQVLGFIGASFCAAMFAMR